MATHYDWSCKNCKIFILSAYWMVGTYLPSSTTKLLGLWHSFFPTMVHLHFLLVGFFCWLLVHSETSHKTTAPVPINCNINIQLVLSNKSKLLMFHNNVIYIIKTSGHHKSLPYTYRITHSNWSVFKLCHIITVLDLPAKYINNLYTVILSKLPWHIPCTIVLYFAAQVTCTQQIFRGVKPFQLGRK